MKCTRVHALMKVAEGLALTRYPRIRFSRLANTPSSPHVRSRGTVRRGRFPWASSASLALAADRTWSATATCYRRAKQLFASRDKRAKHVLARARTIIPMSEYISMPVFALPDRRMLHSSPLSAFGTSHHASIPPRL